jgi:predicted ABC-type ATPase
LTASLDLVAGPNGAGKTTFVTRTLAHQLPPGIAFVNADQIARSVWPDDPDAHAYEAAQIAQDTRDRLIDTGRSFIAETVFSHPSKLKLIDEAKAHGFIVVLHVLMVPSVDTSIARVARRAAAGGHDVPDRKVRDRWERVWPLLAQAALQADEANIYDNSAHHAVQIVKVNLGQVTSARWPDWTPPALREMLDPAGASSPAPPAASSTGRAVVTPNVPGDREWVHPHIKADGTRVDGYWRRKPPTHGR